MIDDLVTWLRAQLNDDERAAGRISRAPMHGVDSPAEKDYLRFADVGRVLAEVDAKRRILNDCEERRSVQSDHLVRLLALPYADQPGYRPEWAPGY